MNRQRIIAAAVLTAVLSSGTAIHALAAAEEEPKEATNPRVYTGFHLEHEKGEETNQYLAESVIPQAVLSEETKAAYPELAKTFSEWNEEQIESSEKTYQHFLNAAKDQVTENADFGATYTDTGTYYVLRADCHIVSLLNITNGYAGGPHGYEEYITANFDPVSGKKLGLEDVVKNEVAFRALLKEKVYDEYLYVEKDLTEQYFEETALNDMIWTAGCERCHLLFLRIYTWSLFYQQSNY